MAEPRDQWHRWLTELRHGGDPAYAEQVRRELQPVRDEVLERAALRPGDTLLDVGTGDGLIAFGALERLGPHGRVSIFEPINTPMNVDGAGRFFGYDAGPVTQLAAKLTASTGAPSPI